MFFNQRSIFCRPQIPLCQDAGIEVRTIATLALEVRRYNHSARSHPRTRLDIILNPARSHPQRTQPC
jgi:hypothetical protein